MSNVISYDFVNQYKKLAGDPTLAELPVGTYSLFRNGSSGDLELWGNNEGTIEQVTSGGGGGSQTLDDTLTLGNTTDQTVIWDKTLSPDADWNFIKILPHQAVSEQLDLLFQRSTYTNPGSSVNNEIFNFGFNVNQVQAGLPGLWESWESGYYPSTSRWLEKHEIYLPDVTSDGLTAGTPVRLSSYTIADNNIDFYHTVNSFLVKDPATGLGYFSLSPSAGMSAGGVTFQRSLDLADQIISSTGTPTLYLRGYTKTDNEGPLRVIGTGATNANLTVITTASNASGNKTTLNLDPTGAGAVATVQGVRGTGTYDVGLNFSTYLDGDGPLADRFVIKPNGEAVFYSTVSMGTGGAIANASSVLELGTTTRGFLPPRMSTSQVNAISTPAEGLEAYDLTLHVPKYYNGSAWKTYTDVPDLVFTNTLTNSNYGTSGYQVKIGSFHLQSYNIDNSFFVNNGYFNVGAGTWTRSGTGYVSGINLYNGQLLWHNQNTGTGDFTINPSLKADYTGKFGIGATVDYTLGSFTGATFYHDGATGSTGIGSGAPSPAASSILDITSTTKGALLPRMTTTQKNAISSPAEGLIVYDLTLHKLCIYTGSAFETITSI